MTDLELLSRRLGKMELRFRWMSRTAIAIGVIITAAALTAQDLPERPFRQIGPGDVLPGGRGIRLETAAAPKPITEAEVRSNHFILVDENGRERASLVSDRAGSVFLVMFDRAGKTRVNLSVSNDGPSLVFYDASGRQRTVIGSTTLVGSHVYENGIAEKAPPSSIVLFDRTGGLLWREP